jgi:2-isopropylmalate synthase
MTVRVEFFDTTLRDGAQSLPAEHQFPDNSKQAIAAAIAFFGVGIIEAGFPATPGDAEEVAQVARTVGNTAFRVGAFEDGVRTGELENTPVIAGLSRTKESDIDATWNAIKSARRPRIHTFVSTDPEHMSAKFPGKTPEDVRKMASRAVAYAKQISFPHNGSSVEFSAEAATTTDPDYLEWVIKTALDEGADVINVPDTVGQRNPFWMRDFYERVIGWVHDINPSATISAHNHNDLGLAVANSFALVQAADEVSSTTGRDVFVQIEGTMCGLGERAGNADLFPVIAGMYQFAPAMESSHRWSINPEHAVSVAATIMSFAGYIVDRQNPIVGGDIGTHRSGIHSDGVIKGGPKLYTPQMPTFWGHPTDARHEEGRYQGTNGRRAAMSQN